MKLNLLKSFWVARGAVGEGQISVPLYEVHKQQARNGIYTFKEPTGVPLTERTPQYEWRHLGNYQSNKGANTVALAQLNKVIDQDLRFLFTRKLSKEGFMQGYELKILPKTYLHN